MKYYKNDIVEQMRVPNETVIKGQRFRVLGGCNWSAEKKSRYRKEEVESMIELETEYGSWHQQKQNLFLYHRPFNNHFKAICDVIIAIFK